jgi:hypothetical protein
VNGITSADVTAGLMLGLVVAAVLTALLDLGVRALPRARICAWCRRLQRGGYLPATHGICPTCFERTVQE